MPGFSDTAAYFEVRASKSKSEDRRLKFAEAARFYRTLGQITPTFPPGYSPPLPLKANGALKADRFRTRAQLCRAIAKAMHDPSQKGQLTRLADTYEEIARSAE